MGEAFEPSAAETSTTAGIPLRVEKPKLLLGEGDAETQLLNALLRHMGINDIAVEGYKGKDNRSGMLESLCMESVADDAAIPCVDAFVVCIRSKGFDQIRLPKVRARAWITTRPKPDIAVGAAAREGYWQFDHSCFDGLKAFVRSL